jgi:hypothetical protein
MTWGETGGIARVCGTSNRRRALDRRSELGNTGKMDFNQTAKTFGSRAIACEKRVFAQPR